MRGLKLDKMKYFWSIFVSVSIWMVIIALCVVFLHNCNRPQFFTISMKDASLAQEVMERKGIVDWTQLQVDSFGILKLATDVDSTKYVALRDSILRMEIKAGRLMTADQMSEKITGYYDKLIDVLIALFILFTIISYFAIRNMSKKEVRDEAREILKDSNKFQGDVLEVLRGEFDGAYLSHEEYDEIIKTLREDVASLKNSQEAKDEKPSDHKKQTVKPKTTSKVNVKVADAEEPAK